MQESRPTGSPPVGIFVLDDHSFVHLGLAGLLSATPDLVVVGEASTAAEGLRRIPETRPRLALLDIGLPDGNGIDVGREIRSRHPDITCLMLTSHDDEEAHLAAVLTGAAGYVIKQIQGPEIVDSIRRAAAGESLLDPAETAQLLDRLQGIVAPAAGPGQRGTDPSGTRLSDREREVLALAVAGRSNREIAEELDLPEDSITRQVSVIFTKLSLERRVQAALRAHRSHVGTFRSATRSLGEDRPGGGRLGTVLP